MFFNGQHNGVGMDHEILSKLKKLAIAVAVGAVIWFIPVPEGLDPKAWQMLAIFVATIVAIMLAPYPMAVIALGAATFGAWVGVISFNDVVQSNGTGLVWLVLLAFFISRGIIQTGLGHRVALFFLKLLGKKTIGLGYGLAITDLILAPAMPSITARAGGVVLPVTKAISEVLGSFPDEKTRHKVGSYLMQCAFQANIVTAAMFITAMAGNPLAVELAGDQGVEITWLGWAIAAFVPGVACLIVIPIILMFVLKPEIKETPDAANLAQEKLDEMGPMSTKEKIMAVIFVSLVGLWVLGAEIGLSATHAAAIGVTAMLLVGVITWKDALEEKAAWDTMIWIGILIMLAGKLNSLGLVGWFGGLMSGYLEGYSTMAAYVIVVTIYFYSHYFFASATAHIGALFAISMTILITAGVDPFTAAITLACMSNVFGCLTQYAIGSAPVMFGAGYLTQGEWWKVGFIMSIVYLIIWMTIGPIWWSIIG